MKTRLLRSLAAGLVGTSWMTAAQELTGPGGGGAGPSWDDAPAPAQLARKVLGGFGYEPPASWIPFLTHAMHWGYGTSLGTVYGLVRGPAARGTITEGLAFGLAAWAASYVEFVPLGIYEPPWTYDAKSIAPDVGYHLAFGVGVATAFDALRPANRP